MNAPNPPKPLSRRTRRGTRLRPWLAVAAVGVTALVVISCSTTDRTAFMPMTIPGSEYVGSAACAECHENITKAFPTATHANLIARGTNAKEAGCESCHGPGSRHAESGGERGTIINPKNSPTACFSCHLDVRAAFSLPNSHPVMNGQMTCQACHDPHQGPAVKGGGTALLGADATCTACHTQQRGPHVFEHEALREGCQTCHNPHGSVNARMLTQRNATLCLRCHFQEQKGGGQVLIGGFDHSVFLSRGTCWSAGCHEAVHGSQVNSSLRY